RFFARIRAGAAKTQYGHRTLQRKHLDASGPTVRHLSRIIERTLQDPPQVIAMDEQAKTKIAVLICTNVIGGHEFQMATLVRDLVQYADLTVYVNHEAHRPMFAETGATTVTLAGQL